MLLIPGIIFVGLESLSRTMALITLIPGSFLGIAYEIYFHGRWGMTIGKRSLGIRVVALDGSPISWKQAFLRSSVILCFVALSTISNLTAILNISDHEYSSLSWLELNDRLYGLAPYITQITIAVNIWVWSEVIVMLFNQKKRSLHDFIAGTVVVDESYQPMEQPPMPDSDAT